MTGNERPDIYADGLREERCENCLHCCATVLRTVHGVERTEYECGRRPEFVHRTQGLARCNYWEARWADGMSSAASKTWPRRGPSATSRACTTWPSSGRG